ncbi:bifunctional 3,4-dihydroxy-2-butanone-4-phosphate synthase/GTP cyclohydrolase II [Porticoccaceae bacterium]|jgi:3,4-dihydroxy 2-butanone 4-phosphate synthase/GTP cyclohydrolase II|nr:bifunctional 3,4-dihydroxy-2-butanone-4-phosphate synthase/GTP cyclohydrolase II [bacterium]MDA7795240.1 bifunctional 3,4-dihydroxy-2-butanone-4-phosphate synthase/GTP cyclohydrolase II [Porticoccaceae bacterium]MDA8898465.1 bifunctional 3,4-dihydroxy-2-butanone-4-phosphate synthase/GTP cyclohydrolase II [Porticoccaceae bacterium]MDB3925538.1 bifunctional 3,4-dihydroxy-2-butanone-4-phosphate synthase/GTP cyclohydrolase II [Porticoccaceae bacterium]
MQLNTVEELIEDIRQGKMVILMDDEDRENEGDLVMAAPMVRPEDINFMATYARGLICLPLSEERCEQLNLGLMVAGEINSSSHATPFTLSIEAAKGVSTGISAADRARTVQAAVASNARAQDIVQPGHIFPLKAQPGGVLSRAGHTEAGCDLARLAGFEPAAVIVEIMNEDGTMARRDDLEIFSKKHDLKIGTIADLINYRLVTEKTTQCISERQVNTHYGEFTLKTYLDNARDEKHFALVMGDVSGGDAPLVRVHVNRSARDLLAIEPREGFQSWSTHTALEAIAKEGRGALVLLYYPESAEDMDRNIDEMLNIKTEKTPPANEVVYLQVGTGSQILMDLGVSKMRLLSAPFKFSGISGFDLEVEEYIDYQDI